MEYPSLRIVTVAFNPGSELATLAASLDAATHLPYEFVIVDNGTENGTVDDVAATYRGRVVRSGSNLGYGGAVNLGAEGFAGQWLLVVNPDVVLSPGCIDALLDETRAWPRGGAFGPLIRTPEGEVYPSARHFPRLISGAGHAVFSGVWPSNPFTAAYRANESLERTHAVDWLSGAFLLMRMAAFEQVGGFDTSYFMFFEDTQLGEDLKAAGWQSIYVPGVEVMHEQGASWRERPANMIRAHHRSAAHYIDGVYHAPYQAPLRWALRLGLRMREVAQVRGARRGRPSR
ncbi:MULTISPECIES: glycosyltransferase family 2 protein [unclassified Actinobaculum]|uniref:glycosyltransferase family 2 protein n=1 Tax=unclassified Actinobaculum TaxID=2609299 RepID=UPI001F0BB5BB|nr:MULTISPECIES: glycosyltransferase family 2 protein [unclassified Actinobaculum]